MRDETSDEHRLQIFRELNEAAHQAGVPDFDAESLAAGHLAGPASTDRPPVPVWEYIDYAATHPEVTIDEISQTRFPISFHGGGSTVTSIAEYMAPGPVQSAVAVTVEDVVRLYALMHAAGAMQWDPQSRTIEELKPRASYAPAIYEKWQSQLKPRSR